MVTVQSEDSGITWETSSSRCSTPWTSETSATSDLYSMESSPVGSPPGKVIFIMDEGKIIRKRKRQPSTRAMMPANLKGGQGNKKRDFSGMQRQEPRMVLADVQGSVLNVEQMEAQDTDEEMLEDLEDLENIAGEPVKRAPIRSIFRESKLRKVGPILGGPVKSRIQLFNSIFGGTGPPPETLEEKTTIQRSSSISGESEHFLETSVRERLQKFSSFSEGTHPKPFQKARSRTLDTPSERRREQRRQLSSQANQSYSSPMEPLGKRLLSKDNVSSKNIKPAQLKEKPSIYSSSGAEISLQHEERKERPSLAETPGQVSGWALESGLPEEAAKQQSYPHSPVAKGAVTQRSAVLPLDPGDKPEEQTLLLQAGAPNQKPEQPLLPVPALLHELKAPGVQPQSAPADSAEELDGQAPLPASVSEHPEKEIQKSAIQSYLPSAPSAKSKYSVLSKATEEDVTPPSSKTAQSEAERVFLSQSGNEAEQQETECQLSATAKSETEYSDLPYSAKKREKQKISVPETPDVHLEKQSIQTHSITTQPESEKQDSPCFIQEAEEQEIEPYSHIPEKTESKYFGISYPVHAETEEIQNSSPVSTAVALDHPVSFPAQSEQTDGVQLETAQAGSSCTAEVNEESERPQMEPEHPDFSFSREEIEESESAQLEMEHPDFSYSREKTEDLESAQPDLECPDFSYSTEELMESENVQLEMKHPDFSYSKEEMVESEGAQLETEHLDFSYSREEMVELEGAQPEMEHLDSSYSREEREELERAQLQRDQPDFSFSGKQKEELQSAPLGMERANFLHSREEIVASERAQLDTEHVDVSFPREEREELQGAPPGKEHSDFSHSKEEMVEWEDMQRHREHPVSSYAREEMVELEDAPLGTERPDFSSSREEIDKWESSQVGAGHADYSREETEELQSAPLGMEHMDFSFSREEMLASEHSQLDTEHPTFSCLRDEVELVSVELDTEHSAFSSSRGKAEESGSAKLEKEHPALLYSRKETEESGSARLEKEHPASLYSREEMVEAENTQVETKQKSVPLELEHPKLSYSHKEAKQQEAAQLILGPSHSSRSMEKGEKGKTTGPELVCASDVPDSTGRAETQQTGYLGSEHSDLPCPTNQRKLQKMAQVDLDNSHLSDIPVKVEHPQSVQQVSQYGDELYSLGKAGEGETIQLQSEHLDSSYSPVKERQHRTSQLTPQQADASYSTGRTDQQEMLQPKSEQAHSPSSCGEAAQEAVQQDLEGPELSHVISKAEQHTKVSLDSENLPVAFTAGEAMREGMESGSSDSMRPTRKAKPWEVAPAERKPSPPFSSTADGQQQEGTPLHLSQPTLLSSGKMEQKVVRQELEQQKTPQHKAAEMGLEHSDLPETYGKGEPWEVEQMGLAQSYYCDQGGPQEMAQPELGHLPLSYSHGQGGEIEMELECPEWAFSTSTEMQEEMIEQKSKQPDFSHTAGKMELQEIIPPEQEQTFLPFSTERMAAQEIEMRPEYPDLSCSFDKAEQEMLRHPTLPFSSKQRRSAPLKVEHPSFAPDIDETKPGDTVQWGLGHPELSYSVGKSQQESELQSSLETLDEAAQDEATQVESKYPKLSCSVGQIDQQETSPLNSKYPDLSHAKEQAAALESESKHQDLPKVTRKRAPPATAKTESKHPSLASSVSKAEQAEIAPQEMKHPDLSHSSDEQNQQETLPSDEMHSEFPIDKGMWQQNTKQQLEQTKFSYFAGKSEQLKHAQQDLEQPDLSLPIDEPNYEMVQSEMEHADVIYPPDITEVQQEVQLELEQTDLTYPFGKTEPKTVEPEMEHPDSALSVGAVEEEDMAQIKLGQPDMSYPVSETGAQQTAQLKSKRPGLAYFTDQVQESTQPRVAQPGVSYAHDKTGQCPPTQLELGQAHLSSSTDEGRWPERSHIVLGHPETRHSVRAAEHPRAGKLGGPDVLSDGEKAEQKGMSELELKHPDLTYSIDKTQPQVATQLSLGKPDLLSSPRKAEQPLAAQEKLEQLGFVHSFSKAAQQEKAQLGLEHPQSSYSVHKAEQKAAYEKLNRSDLSYAIGKLEQHEVIQTEGEQMDLSWPIGEMQQPQIARMDLGYPDLSCSTGTVPQWEKDQPELQQPGAYSSSHDKEQQRERAAMHSGDPELQHSVEEAAGLRTPQVKSEYADLSLSVDTAGPHEMTQSELKEHDLLHSCVKTKGSQAAPLESEYPDFSDSLGKVEHPDSSSSISKGKQIARLEFRLEPMLPCSQSKTEQPSSAQMEVKAQDFLYSPDRMEQQEMAEQVLEHPDLPYSQVNLEQPVLSHSLGKEQQEPAQSASLYSHVSYSIGKAEQFPGKQPKSRCPDLSYSLGKAETHGKKQPELLYSYGEMEQPQMELEQAEMPLSAEEERREGTQPQLQCADLQCSPSEMEQPETPSGFYAFGSIEEQETAQPEPEQSDLPSSTDKAEQREAALLRAGHSEKQDSEIASSLSTPLETEQPDLPFYAEETESRKMQSYSSPPEQSVSVPLSVSHTVSEIKMGGSQKFSPVAAGLPPKHSDLSYTHCKTQQSEPIQPPTAFFLAKNNKIDVHSAMAVQSETKPAVLAEAGREQTPHYFHTATQLESEKLSPLHSIDKAETLENQVYLTVPSELESEPLVPFDSVDETYQEENPSYSKAASEYLVPTYSLAEEEKQDMEPFIPQTAQSEYKHIIAQHDETELPQIPLYSSKRARSKSAQSERISLEHGADQGKEEAQDRSLDTEYFSSKQLRIPSKFTAEQDEQEMPPDVQQVTKVVTAESKAAAVADQQALSSDSFVPVHTLPEKSMSLLFADDEEKQNIPLSLSGIVGMLGKQSKIISSSYNEEKDRHETQPYFTDQEFTSSEQPGAGTSDLIYGSVTHKPQRFSGEGGSFSTAELKSISCISSDEKQHPDVPLSSFGLASCLTGEVKTHSVSSIRAAEVDKQGAQFSSNEASDIRSKQIPAESCKELTLHSTMKNKLDISRDSDEASHEISHRLSSETTHRIERHDLQSPERANPGPEKVPKKETSIGNPTEVEAVQYPDVDKIQKVPEHHLGRKEVEIEHVRAVEDSQHAPEPTEQKDLFNIISEGYEILNIHAPMHISSVDEEESQHMPDKLEYLETNPLFKRKLAGDGHRALASGKDKVEELVKDATTEETGEPETDESTLPENKNDTVLDPDNGMADMDYFEKYTLIDDRSPIKPTFERPSSLVSVTENPNELEEEDPSFKESSEANTLEEDFSLLEDLDEVFYGTITGESTDSYASVSKLLPAQKSIEINSKKVTNIEDERKSPGTPLFDSEEGVLERSLLFPTSVATVNPELLEEPPALSFLYKDLYSEAVGVKTKEETPSDEESGNSNASFPSRNSDTDDGTGIYFEKYILKDEIPVKAIDQPPKDEIPEYLPVINLLGARSATSEQREEENIPVETTEELPEAAAHHVYRQRLDYQGAAHQEAANKQEEQHEKATVHQMEKYIPHVRTPVEDSEDDQYAQADLPHVPSTEPTEKPGTQREEQRPDICEDLAEAMDYDVITQEELLQDEISSELAHEELLFEDRDSFEHIGDSYEFIEEPEQRTPAELEDSGFVVMHPEKSPTNIPQVESPQRELKKAQVDTYCYHCKSPISAIDKLFGEHKDHEVTTLSAAATKMKDQLDELLMALEEKSMKIEKFVSEIESLFNSVEENSKKNAELLEKQNEDMIKKVVAQYDEKSENFEEVKKMKMEYLYEQMVNFQQTVDSAKETLETTVKEIEELDGFVFLNVKTESLLLTNFEMG
uniref:Cardiomyopathy-associated protein 5 n=1 Tax=Nothoprocta perdicaria TaxID=30464 RepID=A0A8C7A1R9_NOTPE